MRSLILAASALCLVVGLAGPASADDHWHDRGNWCEHHDHWQDGDCRRPWFHHDRFHHDFDHDRFHHSWNRWDHDRYHHDDNWWRTHHA
jgi:hypothetical protein